VEAGPDRVLGRLESGPLDFYGGYDAARRWMAGISWEF
jgi:hypothetical protein